jgi:hypothetical protein
MVLDVWLSFRRSLVVHYGLCVLFLLTKSIISLNFIMLEVWLLILLLVTERHKLLNLGFHFLQELLLLTHHRARSTQSQPSYCLFCSPSMLVHDIQTNQSTSSTQTCSAMNSHRSPILEFFVTYPNEFHNRIIVRIRPVRIF